MPNVTIRRQIEVQKTARLIQLQSLFELPDAQKTAQEWQVQFDFPEKWNIGVIVGPSGAGKSTVARELFGDALQKEMLWDADKCTADSFPKSLGINDITGLMSSVGFSSPPSWCKPFSVLSTGEQFRVSLARTLAEQPDLAVVDEFTSVIDRTVAQIGSAAVAKAVRKRDQKFVAVTCHYDVLDWLEPDWVYMPHTGEYFSGRSLQWQRPPITLKIRRVSTDAWEVFRKHHYLDTSIHKAARCFVAYWVKPNPDGTVEEIPVAFASFLHFVHPTVQDTKRGHRTVCLPDFQGVGIGNALSDYMGALCKAMGFRYMSQTAHPAMIRSRNKSAVWKMFTPPRVQKPTKTGLDSWKFSDNRLIASFEYVGPALDKSEAEALWNSAV